MKYIKTLLVLATALAAASASAQNAAGYNWSVAPFGGAGMVTGIFPAKTESGMVYARTDIGGAYRWDKNNAKWVALTDWVSQADTGLMAIESMAVDPKNAANIVMLAGNADFNWGYTEILRSTNYGQSFTRTNVTAQFKAHGNGYGRQSGERLAFDPGSSNVLYVGTRQNGLFKSTDSGASWARLTNLNVTTTANTNGINVVLPDPGSVVGGVAQRLFVAVSRPATEGPNLYRSNDGGQTFTALSGPSGILMAQRGAFDGQGNLYLTFGNGRGPSFGDSEDPALRLSNAMDQGGVWKYNIGNGSWSNVTPAGMTKAYSGISIDPGNPQRIIVSTMNAWEKQWKRPDGSDTGGERIFLSTNGGASWTDVVANSVKSSGGIDWIMNESMHFTNTVVFDPFNTQTAWATSGNGIFKTTNVSAAQPTWTFDVKGLEEYAVLNGISVPGGPLLVGIGDYEGFRTYNTADYAPRFEPPIGNTEGLAMASGNTSIMARVGRQLQVSWNGSVNWYQAAVTNGSKGRVALSANGGVLLHSPENSTTTYRSDNFGASWTPVNNLNINNAYPVADAYHTNLFYAYDRVSGNFWTSYDGGVNFWVASNIEHDGETRIAVPPGVGGEVWVAQNYKGLKRSTNSGSSFTTINNVNDVSGIGFGKAPPGSNYPTVYIWATVGGVRGLFRSTDVGNTWLRINDDVHQYGSDGKIIVGDMNTFGVVYISTNGRGLAVGKP